MNCDWRNLPRDPGRKTRVRVPEEKNTEDWPPSWPTGHRVLEKAPAPNMGVIKFVIGFETEPYLKIVGKILGIYII